MNWHTVLAIDFDKWAARTYAANFPGVRVECGPVADFIDTLPDSDLLLGGPPCQPHSHAGKRGASADSRDCGPDFVAAIAKVKPRMFLMENVPGLLTSEDGRYWHRLYASMEDAGYVCQYRVQDAVTLGVPQFRDRLWVWGIRRDVYAAGVRHRWPLPTHAWPPPQGECLFGANPLPGVTVRQALELPAGIIFRKRGASMGERPPFSTDEPSMTVMGGDGRGGSTGAMYLKSHADAPVSIDRPATTLRSGGAGHDGCQLTVGVFPDFEVPPGGVASTPWNYRTNPHPTPTEILEYRWSDAYRAKHPPIVPDEPCQTVVGQWYKGVPNGCLLVDAPSHTIGAGSREPIQNWKAKGYIRRLTPLECLRLQSAPDSFVWPDGISKTNQYKVIGNGWASGHGAAFSRALRAADPDSRTVIDLFCGGGLGACGWHGRYWALEGVRA